MSFKTTKSTLDSPYSSNPHHRRSLRERLRDGIQSTTGIPLPSFQTKSHSVDSKQCSSMTTESEITVNERDTLTSLAAKYHSTPTELQRLNRLTSRTIFPGQKLKVPPLQRDNSNVFDDSTPEPVLLQKKFIKLKVKHITDGNGVVSGTLLITPNAMMFDPNVSDPLVLDQGADNYGVILPIELVVNAGIWSDISNMRVNRSFVEPSSLGGGVKLYRGQDGERARSERGREGDGKQSKSMTSEELSPAFKEEKESIVKRFSYPGVGKEEEATQPSSAPEWYLCLTTGYPTPPLLNTITPISYGQKRYLKPEYWFSISSADTDNLHTFWTLYHPELYGELDEGAIHSRGYQLIDWSTDLGDVLQIDRRKSTAGEEEVKVQSLTAELTKESWEIMKAPYGKLYSLLQRGQTILTSTTSCDSNYGSTSSGGQLNPNPESEFEIVSLSELEKSNEYFEPELVGTSLILSMDHITSICKHLTARAEGYPWWLVFSTESNGFSLGSLYRSMESVDEWSPVLLVIKDTSERVFGALVSAPLKISEHFYGTGQSFLFCFTKEANEEESVEAKEDNQGSAEESVEATEEENEPTPPPPSHLNVYKWTGENLFFIRGNPESLQIGAGDGKFGIWLDSDLNIGRSDGCWTYGNPPLVAEKDFIVKTCEAWAFGATTVAGAGSFGPAPTKVGAGSSSQMSPAK